MDTIAIIPARGGSKGVPGKNIRMLNGKPLIAHTLHHCKEAHSIRRICVSTDDQEIADIASRHGAEIFMRPAEISGDSASSELALLNVLEQIKKDEGLLPDITVFLQCTSPLITAQDIDGTVSKLKESRADVAFTVTPRHPFLWTIDQNGFAVASNHDHRCRPLRQQMQAQYQETGAVYAIQTEGFLENRHRFFGAIVPYVIPNERSIDIDSLADFEVVEAILNIMGKRRPMEFPQSVEALVMDFDGVFTDNHVWVSEDGTETVRCNRSDGLGISRLKRAGLPMLVLSSEVNPVVSKRCQKLGLECMQGVNNKLSVLTQWCQEENISLKNTVYVGNDLNDIKCLEAVGFGIVVGDAHPNARRSARFSLNAYGGKGALAELADIILEKGVQNEL